MPDLEVIWLYRFRPNDLPGQEEWHGVVKIGPAPFLVLLSGQGEHVALRPYSPCCCQPIHVPLSSEYHEARGLGCGGCHRDYGLLAGTVLRLVGGRVQGEVSLPLILDQWACPPLEAALLTAGALEYLSGLARPSRSRGVRVTSDPVLLERVCRVAAAELADRL